MNSVLWLSLKNCWQKEILDLTTMVPTKWGINNMWVDPSNGELMGTTSLVGIVKYLQTQQHCLQRGPAGRAACCRRGKTYRFVGVGRDAQRFLQWAAVFIHAQWKVSVALVHGRHPFLDLSCMSVTFITEAVGQLDQQLYPLFGLLRMQRGKDSRVQV